MHGRDVYSDDNDMYDGNADEDSQEESDEDYDDENES